MSNKKKSYLTRFSCSVVFLFFAMMFFSCRTAKIEVPLEELPISRNITAKGIKSANQLANFFIDNNSAVKKSYIVSFAQMYIEEANIEGINSDVAFAQMCLETGFLRFGNLVTPAMHNYCGLGSIDAKHPGEKFKTERLGIRAQIQHLQAYSTMNKQLKQKLVDNRYKWVKRGRAQTIFDLAGTWASDPSYGKKLDAILSRLEQY